MTSVQEDSGQSDTTKELDESGEVDTVQKSRSTKEMDELGEGDATEQVMEDEVNEKKDEVCEEEKKVVNEPGSKKENWLNCWKKQWTGAEDIHSKVHPENKESRRTEPAKAPDEAEEQPDKTNVEVRV